MSMNNMLLSKLKESINAVLPISGIVVFISLLTGIVSIYTLTLFLLGSILLIIGMCLFTMGADIAMIPIGEKIGKVLTKKKKIFLILFVFFILGTIVTIAEPDLGVLASQVSSIPAWVLMLSIGLGAGVFLMLSAVKILFRLKLSNILAIMYLVIFTLVIFVPSDFIPLAFDSGGVTAGALTVPLVMALAVGISSIRNDADARNDNFGILALCSGGPIAIVLILILVYSPDSATASFMTLNLPDSFSDVANIYMTELPYYLFEVLISFSPILIFFLVMQFLYLKIRKRQMIKISKGLLYTFFGLVLFLLGANVGFMPLGYMLGEKLAMLPSYKYLLIPLGAIIGYFIVKAEPAVLVLENQVEEITEGNIKGKALGVALSIGIALSVGLTMTRILFDISIEYFLLPGYLFAIGMSFYVPEMFTGIAFDSGGVASGPMSAAFLLPFAIGATVGIGGNVLKDAFGIIGMVALTPLITVQLIGLIYKFKLMQKAKIIDSPDDDLIINYVMEVS